MQFHRIGFLSMVVMSSLTYAHDYTIGSLHIAHPVARATVPGQPAGAVYMSIENNSKGADKLISVRSPVAKSAQIHTMSMDGNVMRMREVNDVELKPASKTVMLPGHGYHIMLIGLKQPLKIGDRFPLTLTFEKAGKLDVSIIVEEVKQENQTRDQDRDSHTHK